MRKTHKKMMTVILCAAATLSVFSESLFAYPPDPDNAALYYYQALLINRKSDDEEVRRMLTDVAKGNMAPNEEVRRHVRGCRDAIYYAMAAGELPNCNWGLRYSDGFSALFPHLAQMRWLCFVMVADARILATDGDYRQALERCMTIRKMARHVGDETIISFLVATAVGQMAEGCIQDILVGVQNDPETLLWLKTRLATVPTRPLSVKAAMEAEQEIALESMRIENVEELKNLLLGESPDPNVIELIDGLDEAFFEQIRRYYKQFIESYQVILDKKAPYVETHRQLKGLSEKAKADAAKDQAALLTNAFAPKMWKIYGHEVRSKARLNALKAAVEIYLVKAGTGRLPEALPDGLPKDPFSGRDFAYQLNKGGFTLRCQGRDLDKDEIHSFEFKI
ncbi:MAG: hypothetical protein JSU94_20455 [Phycisphaerales bacterium]|nr:MAG: hypothetical protein JSU94_20455 [Phycisphaerales bacterium]